VIFAAGCVENASSSPSALQGGGTASIPGTKLPSTPAQEKFEPQRQQTAAQAVRAQATATPHRFSEGEVLYVRNCADCHGWEGKGSGPVGQVLLKKPPSLRQPELFTKNTEAELIARILLGKDLSVPLASDAVQDTEADVASVLTHIRRLPTIPWETAATGQHVYDSLCVSCHGIYGRGDGLMSPSLTPQPRNLGDPAYQKHVSDAELFQVISEGRGAMPGVADVVSVEDRHAVIAFLRLLSPGFELYDRFCEVCHGSAGVPPEIAQRELFTELLGKTPSQKPMPVFDKKYMQTHTEDQLRGWARHMLKQHRAVMPHFGGDLDAQQVRQILAYLRSLPPQS
jgi:mono/diheme cytochrome c family protein